MGSSSSKNVCPDPFVEYNVVLPHLKRGDLIEVKRSKYSHWVICENIDSEHMVWCFHVTKAGDKAKSKDPRAILKYEPLKVILKDTEDKKASLCRINNQEVMANKKALNKPFPDLDKVFHRLHQFKDKFKYYHLKDWNCEHYVTSWKYGIRWSTQVEGYEWIIDWFGKLFDSSYSSVMSSGSAQSQSIPRWPRHQYTNEYEE